MNKKAWLVTLALLSGALAQRGPSTESMAQGLKWVIEGCQLQNQVLTCTINVENVTRAPVNLQIPGASVMAVTSSGWLYLGQATPNTIRLSPQQKTKVSVRFNGISQNTDFFSAIRVGEAWFTGIAIPSQKIVVNKASCTFAPPPYGGYVGLVCTLTVYNDNPQDLEVRVIGSSSFVTLDSGTTIRGGRAYGELNRDQQNFSVIIPAKGELGISIDFTRGYSGDYESFQRNGYFPQKATIVRFQTVGGWIEAREVPFRYCGENYNFCRTP